jgi:GNAT superfamily N-acetyltransferase
VIDEASREAILAVRHQVLRPSLELTHSRYPEDAHPMVFHLAARDDGGNVIACATFVPQALAGFDGYAAWRLRGMATLPEHRGRGIGGQLLEAGIARAAREGADLMWCNGRAAAAAFYLRHGFVAVGDQFQVPPIGAHYLLVRHLIDQDFPT